MYSTVPKKPNPKRHGCELHKNEAPMISKN
jgi:hypothetical protein